MDSYMSFKDLFSRLKLDNIQMIYRWENSGCINTVIVDGVKVIPMEEALHIIDTWEKSCTPIEAAKIIGLPDRGGTLRRYIEKGVIETVNPFGKKCPKGRTRIVLSSIVKGRIYLNKKTERLKERGRINGKSKLIQKDAERITSNHFKVEEKIIHLANKQSHLVIYTPNNLEELEIVGRKRLVTIKSASDFLGIPVGKVEELGFRGEFLDGEYLIYAHSVEIYKKRNTVVEEKTPQKKTKRRR